MDRSSPAAPATILLVDDTPDNLVLMSQLLKGIYKIKVANGGERALKIAAANPPPDLILLDIMMAGMDGYEVCRRLKDQSTTRHIPVIFLTAKAEVEDEERGLALGAVDYITKPISPPIVLARVKNHLALQRKNAELEVARVAAEKACSAKSIFLATVSHELRTPLTSIRGALALIAGGVVGELPANAKSLVDIAHQNCERLILLINDLLDMEKFAAGKMVFTARPLALLPLLQQALEANAGYAAQYQVTYLLDKSLPGAMVKVDGSRMMQVMSNLLSNAAKYSFAGGSVRVTLERTEQCLRVAVTNDGPGIPDDFRSQVFAQFAQADASDSRQKGGTGLGLSIAKAIVEQMGGRIWFDSPAPGQTAFYVEFPELLGELVKVPEAAP